MNIYKSYPIVFTLILLLGTGCMKTDDMDLLQAEPPTILTVDATDDFSYKTTQPVTFS